MNTKLILIGLLLVLYSTQTFAITDTNLVSWYNFDETTGTTLIDIKGYDYNGINTGTSINQVGIINKAYGDFNSANVITMNYSALNTAYNQPFSVCAWVKLTTTNVNNKYIVHQNGAVGAFVWVLTIDNVNRAGFYVGKNGTSVVEAVKLGAIPTATWTHICGTFSGTTDTNGIKVYKDGVIGDYLETYVGGIASTPNTGLTINRNTASEYFPGKIDETSVWDKVLTQSEITDLYNAGVGITYPFNEAGFTYSVF